MLQFDRAILIVHRDDFEQITVQSPVPAPNFREGYPISSVTPWSNMALQKNQQRPVLYSAITEALVLLFTNVSKVEDLMPETLATCFELRCWS